MVILSILPIARGIRKDVLTYFSSEDIPVGSIVGIPIRKKEVTGIVIDAKDALTEKANIKDMGFTLKKIVNKNSLSLPKSLVDAATNIGTDAVASAGAVLATLIPSLCLESPGTFFKHTSLSERANGFDTLAIQSIDSERFDTYKSIIRESLAKKRSVAVLVPTEEVGRMLEVALSKGIAERTISFIGLKSKRSLSEWYRSAHDSAVPKLMIGTYQMLSLLPSSVGTIILEREHSSFYKLRREPFLDIRHVAREAAKSLGVRIIYGDSLLSVETLARVKEGKTQEYSRVSKRSTHKIQTLLVDMKSAVEGEKDIFRVISPDLEEMIRYAVSAKKRLFIYSARRGLSTQTLCRNCGQVVLCKECESPVVLHGQNPETRKFICHHCGRSRSALEQCVKCGGWDLVSYGIGIERIKEEVEKIAGQEVIQIDSDTCKSPKEVIKKIDEFLAAGSANGTGGASSILVGTDLAVSALQPESVEFAAIPAIDSLASLPDFRTNERLMHVLLDVKARATECLLVQSRNTDHCLIDQALTGDLELFAKDEIRKRKEFGYPPYQRLVKLTISGKKDRVREDVAEVSERLRSFKPRVFPAFIKSTDGDTHMHIMLKIAPTDWPNRELSSILLSLPPSVKIDTTPQSLL